MGGRDIGKLLVQLRKEQGFTQRDVAERLCVSTQAVSKWERGIGCPDVSLLPALSALFGVSMEQLLSGCLPVSPMEVGHMKRMKFFVCPDCGNIITAAETGELYCCGRKLEALRFQPADEQHTVSVQEIEEDWYVTFSHPMEKEHYFRFAAYVTMDRMLLVRLYPEQGGEFRIPQIRGGGKMYLCCSKDGLFEMKTETNKRRTVRREV